MSVRSKKDVQCERIEVAVARKSRLVEPTNVAEVLTRRQVLVLGIHAEGSAERTSHVDSGLEFKGVEVAFVLHHLHRIGLVDHVVASFGVLTHHYAE